MTPNLLASPSLAQVEGLTKAAFLKRFLRDTGLGVYGTVTAADSADTFVDTTSRASVKFSDSLYEGWWVRVSAAGSAAPEDEIRVVDGYIGPAGFFRVLPTFTATLAAADTYELWQVDPQLVLDMLDQVLTEDIYLPCWSILSEVPDFDMEQSGTSDWTASNATLAKSTAEPLMAGKRYLTVAATSGNGYARSALFNVESGHPYTAGAMARAGTSNAKLVVYDETNGAEITSVTVDKQHNVRVQVDFQTPATCVSLSLRLLTVTSGQTTSFDEVLLYSQQSSSISLPWWVKNKGQVKGVFKLTQMNSLDDHIYSPELRGEPDRRWDVEDTAFGRGQLELRARRFHMSQPLFIFGTRNETAYANNTEEKLVDSNFLVACLAYRVFNNLVQTPSLGYLEADWLKERAEYWTKQWKLLGYQQMERLEQVLVSDSPMGYYLNDRYNY